MSEILIKRFDPELPLPEYKTAGAAGFDLSARMTVTVEPNSLGTVPLNVAMQAPEGYWIMFVARSSLQKKGLMMANGVAIMDADFCGDNDEYRAILYNFSGQAVTVERGERIVQAIVMPLLQFPIRPVESLANPDRGGFGTTGRH
jgi:dUTP pyrophosphatase